MNDYEKYIDVGDAVKVLYHDCVRYVFPTTAEPTTEFIKLDNAINLLQLYPSADVAPKWIPCDERLPEIVEGFCSKEVIVCLNDGALTFTHLEENIFGQVCWEIERMNEMDDIEQYVIAWMPLPKPYEGERENDDRTCDTCKHYDNGWDDAICDGCTTADSHWERKDDE